MIAPGIEAIGEVCENPFTVMDDFGGLAMERSFRPRDLAAEHFADHLMSEADAEDWKLAGIFLDDLQRLTRLMWRARAGRDDDGLGLEVRIPDFVIPHDMSAF